MPEEPRAFVPHSYEELADASDERIVEGLRYEGKHLGTVGFRFLLEEMDRREQRRATDAMLSMTRHLRNMTIALVVFTVASVVIAGVLLWIATSE